MACISDANPTEKYTLPVLILTARDTLNGPLPGWILNADDYLVKPFATGGYAPASARCCHHNNPGESELTVGNLTALYRPPSGMEDGRGTT